MSDPVVAEVKAVVAAEVSKAKTFETKVFAFLQAHYVKAVAAIGGFLVSHYGVIAYIVGKIL